MAQVCITGNEQSAATLEQRLERVLRAYPSAICELRLDFLDFTPVSAFAFLARLPSEWAPRLIITQRLKTSGELAQGHCDWSVLTWQSWWRDVMALRPWYAVDLDYVMLDRLAGESLGWGGKLRAQRAFFSLHASLGEAAEIFPTMMASAKEHQTGVKLACPVASMADLLKLAQFADAGPDLPIRSIVAMGKAGRAWRWSRLAGDLTYFAAEDSLATAPGQDTLLNVAPYLRGKDIPDLYLLLGDNPENTYGESQWNRVFLRRKKHARYLNLPLLDTPSPEWAEQAKDWMTKAGVRGASVTKPFKTCFPTAVNTLHQGEATAGGARAEWLTANTDGPAVLGILRANGVRTSEKVLIAGGGGAAKAAQEVLTAAGFTTELWVRKALRLPEAPRADVLISTWPGEYQEDLLRNLPAQGGFHLVVDAQFSRSEKEAPLALYCKERKIPYVHGSVWWKKQARLQDEIWFGKHRLGHARESILELVPSSKSETLRALALAAAFRVPTEIDNPSVCTDTKTFADAMESLGFLVDVGPASWKVFPPSGPFNTKNTIDMGEGATGFRILALLSTVMDPGAMLTLDAAPSLKARPQEYLGDLFGIDASVWPLKIPTGGNLPTVLSLARTSQFASGVLIAAAGLLARGEAAEFTFAFEGERRSETYLGLTLEFLRAAGIEVSETEAKLRLRLKEKSKALRFVIAKDASSLAFFDVLTGGWGLEPFLSERNRQGDSVFPEFYKRLLADEPLSLKDYPDLAPPLWAAAVLQRKKITVVDCPHLRLKESDRALLLVKAAVQLGASAEVTHDGFRADFSGWRPQTAQPLYLETQGDHRLAMAFGIVGTEFPHVQPDRRDCVAKSFPDFWQALEIFLEAMPGS